MVEALVVRTGSYLKFMKSAQKILGRVSAPGWSHRHGRVRYQSQVQGSHRIRSHAGVARRPIGTSCARKPTKARHIEGGGLRRSATRWQVLPVLERGRERWPMTSGLWEAAMSSTSCWARLTPSRRLRQVLLAPPCVPSARGNSTLRGRGQ